MEPLLAMIWFQCPTCNKRLTASDSQAHGKVLCPKCKQKIKIPASPAATDKTKLGVTDNLNQPDLPGSLHYDAVLVEESAASLPPPIRQPAAAKPASHHQYCQACGTPLDLSGIAPNQGFSCPKCGRAYPPRSMDSSAESAFKGINEARPQPRDDDDEPRYREYQDDDDEDRGCRCPFCRYRGRLLIRQKIAPAGWAVLGVVAGTCFLLGFVFCLIPWLFTPLCLLGLLIKQNYRVCGGCGMPLP